MSSIIGTQISLHTTDLVLKVVENILLTVDRFEKAMEFVLRVYLAAL